MNPYPRTWIEVDLPAIAWNLGLVRKAIGPDPMIGLVAKADAYGHGIVPVCRHALGHGAGWACVATVQEGVALRDAGIDQPILVLSPVLEVEADQVVFYGLRVMAEEPELARALSRAAQRQGTVARVHLPIDTGLARFGCRPQDAPPLASFIAGQPGLMLEGVGSHFADSANDPERTDDQEEIFEQAIASCRAAGVEFEIVHLANSAAAARRASSRHELVRIGISAYGLDPYRLYADKARPVMTWKARVMSLRSVRTGSRVGYGSTYTTTSTTRIATLGVGYGDGYPRSLSNKGFVVTKGARLPVVGLVCMDQLLVDAGTVPWLQVGDEAELVGAEASAVELATLAATNVHEIVTRIMSRVPRRYRHDV